MVDVNALTSQRALKTEEISLEGIGTIKVRALTRAESHEVSDAKTEVDKEKTILRWGMVDPEMSYQDVDNWMAAAPADQLQLVTLTISHLSGMLDGEGKQMYERFRAEAGC